MTFRCVNGQMGRPSSPEPVSVIPEASQKPRVRQGFRLFGCAQWEEILRAFHRLLQPAKKLL
jgi:hypothetical protein